MKRDVVPSYLVAICLFFRCVNLLYLEQRKGGNLESFLPEDVVNWFQPSRFSGAAMSVVCCSAVFGLFVDARRSARPRFGQTINN